MKILYYISTTLKSNPYLLVLLELIKVIEKKSRHINQGKIIIGFDHRKSHNKIIKDMKNTSDYVQEAGTEIVMIKKEIKKIEFKIEITYIKSYTKDAGTWSQ